MEKIELTKAGRREIALALHLWKDFKRESWSDVETLKQTMKFAEILGVTQEFDELNRKLLFPFKITIQK